MITTMPYGTWPSPLGAADLFAGGVQPADLAVDDDDLWWVENRPGEGGRLALVRWRDGEVTEVSPDRWNCRTRVHEYGGAPFAVRDEVVFAASFADQRWWRLDLDEPRSVTPEPATTAGLRYADAAIAADGRVIAVEERHEDGEPTNRVVQFGPGDRYAALVEGRDFVAAPRLSPDGTRLVWLAWDHPHMPWDAAELWMGTVTADGLTDVGLLSGGPGNAACHPVWIDDERLAWSVEVGAAWRPVIATLPRGGDEPPRRLIVGDLDGEVGGPAWTFGWSHLAPLADGRTAAVVTRDAVQQVVLLADGDGGAPTPLDDLADLVRVDTVLAHRDGLAILGSTGEGGREVRTWTADGGATTVMSWPLAGVRTGDVPAAEPMSFPTPDGATTHAMVYRPASAAHVGPADERPPLLVFTHGGPTGNVFPVPHRGIVYWTSRGFAVADVNYRGSTGYGQEYRNALQGQWGVLDVVDSIAVAHGLAEAGIVDGDRMAIRGGSAGGFTTLAVLTTPDHPFACGTSFFGVADLQLLAEHTHKFESRYLDGLVGSLPEDAAVYRERSPLHRTDQLTRPILVLQGLEDEVVPPEQSELIVAAAAANGVPHAYLAFPGEQHGFRRLEHQVRWHEAELAFYGQVMGFTPAGNLPELALDGTEPAMPPGG